jgi:hypothetical protein
MFLPLPDLTEPDTTKTLAIYSKVILCNRIKMKSILNLNRYLVYSYISNKMFIRTNRIDSIRCFFIRNTFVFVILTFFGMWSWAEEPLKLAFCSRKLYGFFHIVIIV